MSDAQPLFIAVDLGAGSGRVMLGGLGPGELDLREVRRFRYPMEMRDGHLRWPFPSILAEIKAGLRDAGRTANVLGRPVHSLGVDTWGVDYGLLDREGRLIEDPICYRDARNEPAMNAVLERVPRAEIFDRTGIQFLVFNTLFQLWAHAREGLPAQATRLLLVPDLINFFLTGRAVIEASNASTTQMVDVRTGAWDRPLLERLGLPVALLPEIVPAGTDLGPLRAEIADEVGLPAVRVIAPATHDTGSAVAGAPLEPGWAYISSGTWSLVGVERTHPLVGAEVARENFTNEGGAFGTVRFLKNVMGLWLLESCRREWQEGGLSVAYDELLAGVAALAEPVGVVFPDDPRFLNPPSMVAALARQLGETGQPDAAARAAQDPVFLTRLILDSLALRYASVLRTIERLTGATVAGTRIIGGGSLNAYLNQATADASGRPVVAGPVEATAIGNLLVQAVSAGRFPSLAAARAHVAATVESRRFEARRDGRLVGAWAERYAGVEARFVRS